MRAFLLSADGITDIYPFHTKSQYLKDISDKMREQYIFLSDSFSEHFFNVSDIAVPAVLQKIYQIEPEIYPHINSIPKQTAQVRGVRAVGRLLEKF